jgi:asparagine synthetase B (glutamine-hydrolysing)
MAWGLEARVPFLDKSFMEVAMGVRPEDKLFTKGTSQELDEDGRPKMEKYILRKAFDVAPDGKVCLSCNAYHHLVESRHSHTFLARFCGDKRSSSPMALVTPG